MNQTSEKSSIHPKLWPLSYNDNNANIFLTTYVDTLVFDSDNGVKTLAAVRFGGYAEQVRGMADAIYGGGTVRLLVEKETLELQCPAKHYRRMLTNDELYTEAALLIQDDRQEAGNKESDDENADKEIKTEKEKKTNGLRTSYIFCESDNQARLFEEIDKKVSIPLIPEFSDYVVSELLRRGILKKLTVLSFREKFDAWKLSMDNGEHNIINVIEAGLRSGTISIPGGVNENPFTEVKSVSAYLNSFGITIAEKIKGQFNPLYDPSCETLSKEVLAVNSNIKRKAGYYLYNAQLAVAESLKRRLDRSKFALCVAECGSGKTKIGAVALCAHQTGKKRVKTFNLVLCPSHLSKKWVREIEETLPNTTAIHITNITELNKVYAAYQRDSRSCYAVITKEKARDGYMKRPAVLWDRIRHIFKCPECGFPVMMDAIDEGAKYKVEADHFFFQRENSANHKCSGCGGLLWAELVPEQQGEWVKISNYGFVHRKHVRSSLAKLKDKLTSAMPDGVKVSAVYDITTLETRFPKVYHDLKEVANNPNGIFLATGAYNRYPLSTYIKKKMRGKIDGLIIDELQDYNNNSGQGDAMSELFGAAKKVVGLTGTLINGYSQGIFYLLYRVAPQLMLLDDKKHNGTKEFNDEYGVTESTYEMANPEYNSNRRTVRRKIRERQLPGVSPLVYSRFLIDSTAFLSLNDMGKQLPEYEEIPVPLNMRPEIANEYKRLEEEFTKVMRDDKKIAKKVMSAFMGLLTVYPDQPYDMKPIVSPINGSCVVQPQNTSKTGELNEKDLWLLEKVREKTAAGGRVIVYTSWIRIDTQDKLLKLFTENGIHAEVLSSTVAPNKREEWVEKRVNNEIQVLITNPSLVETGLDLNDFATLVYYNISYKLFTLRQSSRRSWRINQKAPRVEVYFLYFKNVMQHRAIRLMASKLAVAGIIEGNFTDEGLAAMSECQDLTTLLAQELMLGIKNEVEDLGEVFMKMAMLKSDSDHEPEQNFVIETEPDEALLENIAICVRTTQEVTSETGQQEAEESEDSVILAFRALAVKTKKAVKKKEIYADPNQISIFDVA